MGSLKDTSITLPGCSHGTTNCLTAPSCFLKKKKISPHSF